MAIGSYTLCVVLAAACAFLLLRQYQEVRSRLLLWSGVCFVLLCISHVLVIADLVWFPNLHLYTWRNLTTLLSVLVLLYGIIWEVR